MDEFENDDAELNAPLDIRFVLLGLILMVSSLFSIIYFENALLKDICRLLLLASFIIMVKKDARNKSV